jgi:uncharacterized protein YjbI with pentapeptide repeats
MFAKIHLILSILGLLSILNACSSQPPSPSALPNDLPSQNLTVTPTPQSSAGMQTSSRFDCQMVEEIPVEECQVLVRLYENTDGDRWQDHTGWLVTRTPCAWYGVICERGYVVELQLYYNELAGSLSPEIGKLAHLKNLYLDSNQLSGALPPELGNLTALEVARLGKNQFSGSIPAEIGNLERLMFLELWGNELSGELPSELGELSKLQELKLHSNRLTGSIPPELGDLANLTNLDLSHNQLSGSIPASLGDLTNLNWLDLSYNQLSGSIPTEMELLPVLYWLDLSYNRLTGAVPAGLAKPPKEDLRFWGNQLEGTIFASDEPMTAVEFQGVQFRFNSSLAESVWPEIAAALPPQQGAPEWGGRPQHIGFTFASNGQPHAFPVRGLGLGSQPQIFIYPVQEFSTISELAKGQIEGLQSLLKARPSAPEDAIPLLPLINAAQVLHAQVRYLDFENGSGVRFITQYSQEVVGRLTNQNIFYTFQGLTRDGKYYVAAFFPITASGLSDELVDEPSDAAQAHLAEDIQHLNSLSSQEFDPDLLDSLIESMVVDTP